MRTWSWIVVAALLLAAPAQASETFRIRSNCGSGNEAGVAVAPTPDSGDYANFVVTWKKSQLLVIAELICLIDDDVFTFGSWAADADGSLQITAGTFGDVCALFLCTASGSDKATAAAWFGAPDSTLTPLSAVSEVPARRLVPARAADFPGASERLAKLAAAAQARRGARR